MPPKLLQLLRDNARNAGAATPLRNEVTQDGAHIYLFDVISDWWGASATQLIDALKATGNQPVHLHINSPGGDVFEARAMAAAIAAHPQPVTCHIDGYCASAATYVALAGSGVRITDGGMFMIHNSWTIAMGNAGDLRSTADLLDKIDGTIRTTYAKRTGATDDQVRQWMDAETWFTAQEALDAGFVDAIDSATQSDRATDRASAPQWDLSAYDHAPAPRTPPAPVADDTAIAAQLARNQNRLRLLSNAARI